MQVDNISVPRTLLAQLLDLARDHIEDFESGLEDGTYDKSGKADCEAGRAVVDMTEALVASEPPHSLVDVQHWDLYGRQDEGYLPGMTHQMSINDARISSGQLFVDVGVIEGNLDETLSTIHEITADPIHGLTPVAGVHVSPDYDEACLSVFRMNDGLVLRLDTNVALESIDGRNDLFRLTST